MRAQTEYSTVITILFATLSALVFASPTDVLSSLRNKKTVNFSVSYNPQATSRVLLSKNTIRGKTNYKIKIIRLGNPSEETILSERLFYELHESLVKYLSIEKLLDRSEGYCDFLIRVQLEFKTETETKLICVDKLSGGEQKFLRDWIAMAKKVWATPQ